MLEEVGVQGEVIKSVLLAGPTLCLGAGNFSLCASASRVSVLLSGI